MGRLQELRVLTYPHLPLVDRIWELRENLTAYDASYVALAGLMDSSVVTTDRGLAAVAQRTLGADRVHLLR